LIPTCDIDLMDLRAGSALVKLTTADGKQAGCAARRLVLKDATLITSVCALSRLMRRRFVCT